MENLSEYYLSGERPSSLDVIVQKCFRHNDLDKLESGHHLSLFEMPATWYVGDFEVNTVLEKIGSPIDDLQQ